MNSLPPHSDSEPRLMAHLSDDTKNNCLTLFAASRIGESLEYYNEHTRPEGSPLLAPLDFSLFQASLREALLCDSSSEKEVLSDGVIQNSCDFFMQDAKLPERVASGSWLCPVLLPSNEANELFTDAEIQQGVPLKILLVNDTGAVVRGFGRGNNQLFQVLPLEVQRLAIPVPQFTVDADGNMPLHERQQFVQKFRAACHQLQELINGE